MGNIILNYKTKLLVLCLSTGLVACGGGSVNPESQHKSVSISATSTIPTKLGISGSHAIKVDNHTGTNLTLNNFYLSDARENDSRIKLAGCQTLAKDSSCVLRFSPDEADGSTVLKLDFVDENGRLYSAAQLVEYSSQVNQSNGFYLSSSNLENLTSTGNYSLAIPFVADDDYSSISIDTSIKTLSKSVDCAQGTNKGSHCTALLTLPAADSKFGGYNNSITIKGVKADGSVNSTSIASRVSFSDVAHLAISSGPLLIKVTDLASGHPNSSQTIKIVNNGDQPAGSITESSLIGASWLEGVTTAVGTASLLNKAITCNGNPAILTTLPRQLNSGEFCEVKFTLANNPNATGSEDYSVSYTNGINGVNPTVAKTKVYFHGLFERSEITITPDSAAEIVMGESFNFTATLSGTGSSTITAQFANPLHGVIISEPQSCDLDRISGKTSCRFSATITQFTTWNTTLATGEKYDYRIGVFSNNSLQINNPVMDFSVITPTTFVPSTGQTATLPLDPAPEGSDGKNQTGVSVSNGRFTRGAIGTPEEDCITDNLTGLMWVKNLNNVKINGAGDGTATNLQNAINSVNSANQPSGVRYCGHNDWHLPTVNELTSLLNYSQTSQVTWLSNQGFAAVQASKYLSLTSNKTINNFVRHVDFSLGLMFSGLNSDFHYVWPVRRASAATSTRYPAEVPATGETGGVAGSESGVAWPNPRFVVGRGTTESCITDKLTGLMWLRNGSLFSGDWYQALSRVAQINNDSGATAYKLCGYSDWRLPNIIELRSLYNYSQSDNSMPTWLGQQGFINISRFGFVSSTTYANDTNKYLTINPDGALTYDFKTSSRLILLVRGGRR